VTVEGLRSVAEDIPFETETKRDSRLSANSVKIEQEGQPGIMNVTFTHVSRNGVILELDVFSEVVTKEPVKKIILEGAGVYLATGSVKIQMGSGTIPTIQWPLDEKWPITSGFRIPARPNHNGTDVGAPTGTPLYATLPGTIIYSGWASGYGNQIVIDHGDGVGSRYAHLSSMSVSAGTEVTQGQYIGAVGNTGNSYGSHLHFEIFTNTDGLIRYFDPVKIKNR
jgi:murein DD-endopeptidase MepM/ murein hydrolase activator NlpD